MAVTVRPMAAADVELVRLVSVAAFATLDPPDPPAPPGNARRRIEHLLGTDPGGCWVAEHDGRVVGAAIAIVRDGLWGLSLLVVDPGHQSRGTGRELLARAAGHGDHARGHLILSSTDARAVSAYLALGLDLRPAAAALGHPREVSAPDTVRAGGEDDAALIAAVDRHVRGAPHGSDIDALRGAGHRVSVFPERGYVVHRPDSVALLGARDRDAAADLLRAALAQAGDDGIRVEWLTADQQWAVDVCREAGLRFTLGWGALLTRGEVGPLAPYLPSGAYL